MHLSVAYGPTEGGPFELHEGDNIAGRSPECEICLPSKRVSRQHCVFVLINGRVAVRDLDSQNGVVDASGNRVALLALTPGDRVQLGDYLLMLEHEATDSMQFAEDDLYLATSEIEDDIHLEDEGSIDDTAGALRAAEQYANALGFPPPSDFTTSERPTVPGRYPQDRPNSPRIEARPGRPRVAEPAPVDPTPRFIPAPRIEPVAPTPVPAPTPAPVAPLVLLPPPPQPAREIAPAPQPIPAPQPVAVPRPTLAPPLRPPSPVVVPVRSARPRVPPPEVSARGVPWAIQASFALFLTISVVVCAPYGGLIAQTSAGSELASAAATAQGAAIARILAARNAVALGARSAGAIAATTTATPAAEPPAFDLSVIATDYGVQEVRLCDVTGTVVAPADKARMQLADRPAMKRAMESASPASAAGPSGSYEFVAPVRDTRGGPVLGYAWVDYNVAQAGAALASPWPAIVGGLMVFLFIAVVLSFSGWWLLLRPLQRLASGADRLTYGRDGLVTPPIRLDSAERIARALNELASRAAHEGQER